LSPLKVNPCTPEHCSGHPAAKLTPPGQPALPHFSLPHSGGAVRNGAEFEGKPLFGFEGNSKNFTRDFNHIAQKFEGNSGAKSAGENARL
jgi:hypothetical protein